MKRLAIPLLLIGLVGSLAPTLHAEIIADSIDDWSVDGEQGENGWSYGLYNLTLDEDEGDGDYSADDFLPFLNDGSNEVDSDGANHWDGARWRLYRDGEGLGAGLPNTGPWTRVEPNGVGHPNGTNSLAATEVDDPVQEEHWAIRRWESSFTGSVEITVDLTANNLACGNGTSAHLYHNGSLVTSIFNVNDPIPVEESVTLSIAQGDFLDYALSPEGEDGGRGDPCDGSTWNMFVDSLSAGIPGDFDADGTLAAADIDQLTAAVLAGGNPTAFDLTGDGLVNASDRSEWVTVLRKTWFGDSNLDGEFNSSDLVTVFTAGEYEDTVEKNSTWATGDWNGDLDFTSSDLVTAFSDGGFEFGPRAAVAAVPEPSCFVLLLSAALLLGVRRKA